MITPLLDLVLSQGTSYTLVWEITELNPSSYSVFIDGVAVIDNIAWLGGAISFELPTTLSAGVHEIVLEVRNTNGRSAQDSVMVYLIRPGVIITEGGFLGLESQLFVTILSLLALIALPKMIEGAMMYKIQSMFVVFIYFCSYVFISTSSNPSTSRVIRINITEAI